MAYMCAENGNLMAIAQQLVQQQQQHHHQPQAYSVHNHPSNYFVGAATATMGMGMGVGMGMGISPWLNSPSSSVAAAWHEGGGGGGCGGGGGGMSFTTPLCNDVMADLCSTTTATSYLSEPNSVLDLSRASILFSPIEQFHEFGHHLMGGATATATTTTMEAPPASNNNGLYSDGLVKKERATVKDTVFRLPELQTFGGFDSPVNVVGPDSVEWMDCLMTDLQTENVNANNNSITSCFDSNPCESTESSELPSNGRDGYRGSEDAWQSEFGLLGEAFVAPKQRTPWTTGNDTTTELLCSSPSADLLSAASSELLSSSSLKNKHSHPPPPPPPAPPLGEQYGAASGAMVSSSGGLEFQPLLHRIPSMQNTVQLKREPVTPPQKWQGGQDGGYKPKRDEDSKPEIDIVEKQKQGPSSHLFHSLLDCAKMVEADPEGAGKSIAHLQTIASPQGDPAQRVVFYFANALMKRVSKGTESQVDSTSECLERSTLAYKALNDACPYAKFAHLTANQAILEGTEKAEKIHIIDFGIVQGIQWAAILQAFATRPGGKPRKIKITGIPAPTLGENSDHSLLATGNRLKEFATLLDLEFEFCPLSNHMSKVDASLLKIEQDESVAINFMLQLYHLVGESSETLMRILKLAHSLEPKVVTLGEYEANLNACRFQARFRNALDYYSAFFESMEPSMKRDCPERISVEKLFFAEKITGIVAYEGANRKIRLDGKDQWRALMETCGFKCSPLSHYAMSQARILLWNYSDRYSLVESPGFLSLAWQDQPLLSVSAWSCC